MIKVRSILHKDEVIEVSENHYYDVLVRSKTWELVEPEKVVKPTVVEDDKEDQPTVVPILKKKAGRPKQIKPIEE